jgi:hypothetical protein
VARSVLVRLSGTQSDPASPRIATRFGSQLVETTSRLSLATVIGVR